MAACEGGLIMKSLFMPMVLLLALSVPALAQNNQGQNNNDQGARGAPGPIAGAGLTVLLIGGGIYWIVRRKKRAS
jgi:LPXTG-motif cell wall-anchored protein